jgi:hypothetical protein
MTTPAALALAAPPGRSQEEVLAKLVALRCDIARMYMIRKRLEMERDETTRWPN